MVRAMRIIRARVGRRGKYRKYGGMRVGLVGISYEVVLLLLLLRLRRRWRKKERRRENGIGKYKQGMKEEERREKRGRIE